MAANLMTRLKEAEKRLIWGFGDDISTPRARRLARLHTHVADHAFLRRRWTNLDLVAPGVWRANQPDTRQMDRYSAMGIRSILTLRGKSQFSYHLFEKEDAARLGIALRSINLSASMLVARKRLLRLTDLLGTLERPLLIHCKSGADRTGLAAAIHLIAHEGVSPERAMDQLSFRYLHRSSTHTGILDFMLETFARDHRETGVPFRQWVAETYDHAAITEAFERSRAS